MHTIKARNAKWAFRVIVLNPLSANPTKQPNTLKQFVGKFPTNCLSVFDYLVKLALKGLRLCQMFALKLMRLIRKTQLYFFSCHSPVSNSYIKFKKTFSFLIPNWNHIIKFLFLRRFCASDLLKHLWKFLWMHHSVPKITYIQMSLPLPDEIMETYFSTTCEALTWASCKNRFAPYPIKIKVTFRVKVMS